MMKHIVPILLLVATVLPAQASPRKPITWPRPFTAPRLYAPPRPFTAPSVVAVPRPVTSMPYGEHYVEGRQRADGTYVPGHFRANTSRSLYGGGTYGSKPYASTVKPYTGKRTGSTPTYEY